jgi:hypothetical protein
MYVFVIAAAVGTRDSAVIRRRPKRNAAGDVAHSRLDAAPTWSMTRWLSNALLHGAGLAAVAVSIVLSSGIGVARRLVSQAVHWW